MAQIFRHKQTHKEYKILVFDCYVRTSHESFSGVVYYSIDDPMQIYCLSQDDFKNKYQRVESIEDELDDLITIESI